MALLAKLFFWFVLYSFFGWVWESTMYTVKMHHFVNRGFLIGPYCPIYGAGALLDILVLGDVKNPVALFFTGATLACIIEYFTSWALQKIFHHRWWNYSDRWFNINGRVCLLGFNCFGAFAVILNLFVQPYVAKMTDRIPIHMLYIISGCLFVIMISDVIISMIGFKSFPAKLQKLTMDLLNHAKSGLEDAEEKSAAFEKTHSGLLEHFVGNMNLVEKHMIKAFPKLEAIEEKSNQTLTHIVDAIQKDRKGSISPNNN